VLEPFVLVRGMVGHNVHDDSEAELVGGVKEFLRIGERPKNGIDIAVVRHVIPAVFLRGSVERGKP